MRSPRRGRMPRAGIAAFIVILWASFSLGRDAAGQQAAGEPANTARPDPAPAWIESPSRDVRRGLTRLELLINDQKWVDAAEVADGLLTAGGDGWIKLDEGLYAGVREAATRVLAEAPAEGVAAYRSRVDTVATQWLAKGVRDRDEAMLRRIVEQAFLSSASDDALWSIGELALERGETSVARNAWQLIHRETAPRGAVFYPDSELPLADVRAAMALADIRGGRADRAADAIAAIEQHHPGARGRLGGQEVELAPRLSLLLSQMGAAPPKRTGDWPTLLGNYQRTGSTGFRMPAGARFEEAWSAPIAVEEEPPRDDAATLVARRPPSVYPVVAGGDVWLQGPEGVYGFQLESGGPAIGREPRILAAPESSAQSRMTATAGTKAGSMLLAPTVDDGRLFALWSQALRSSTRGRAGGGRLIGVDLGRDAALAFTKSAGGGSNIVSQPLVMETRVIVAEAKRGGGVGLSLAAYDLWTRRLLWRRPLGAGSTPFDSMPGEYGQEFFNVVLTADAGMIFAAPGLGYIAAVHAGDGSPAWLRTYRRRMAGAELSGFRMTMGGAVGCVAYNSTIAAAPLDSAEVMSIDARTGRFRWTAPLPADDAVIAAAHDGQLVMSGERLWRYDVKTGALDPDWGDEARPAPGTCVVAGAETWFPSLEGIMAVDWRSGRVRHEHAEPSITGGANLAIAGDRDGGQQYLIAAGHSSVIAFRTVSE